MTTVKMLVIINIFIFLSIWFTLFFFIINIEMKTITKSILIGIITAVLGFFVSLFFADNLKSSSEVGLFLEV